MAPVLYILEIEVKTNYIPIFETVESYYYRVYDVQYGDNMITHINGLFILEWCFREKIYFGRNLTHIKYLTLSLFWDFEIHCYMSQDTSNGLKGWMSKNIDLIYPFLDFLKG